MESASFLQVFDFLFELLDLCQGVFNLDQDFEELLPVDSDSVTHFQGLP